MECEWNGMEWNHRMEWNRLNGIEWNGIIEWN